MKTAKLFLVSVAAMLFGGFAASAQDDDCMLYLSYYQEYYKQNTKDARKAALPSWRKAYSICAPGTRQNLYVHGAVLYRMLIAENAKNPVYKEALVDTLMTLNKLRAQYYPKYADKAYSAMSADINNYLKDNPAKAYELSNEVIAAMGAASAPVTYTAMINASVELYKSGKLTAEQVINDYDKASGLFDELQKTDESQDTKNLRTTFDNIFINSGIASCENLIALFGPRYEQSKDDYAALSKIVKLMAVAEDCTDNDLFLKAVTSMYQLQPNAASAYYLYRLNVARGKNLDAIKYLEEACASDELDNATKGQYFFELAALCLKSGNNVKAVDAATKAIAADESFAGKANMLIGHAWMGITCVGNEIEKRAKFWVAVDYFARAKAADESVAEDAAKQISACAQYYPGTAEAFMYDLQNGQSYTVSCGGLRATTTVKTQK